MNIKSIIFLPLLLFSFSLQAQQSLDKDRILAVNDAVNDYRASRGLNKMRLLQGLCEIAQAHAEDMAAGKVKFSHAGFDDRVSQMKSRYRLSAYSAAENLYYTSTGVNLSQETVRAWIRSSGHHKNLKGDFSYNGIGIARDRRGHYYVVQVYLEGS